MPVGCSPDVWLKKTSRLRRPYECGVSRLGSFNWDSMKEEDARLQSIKTDASEAHLKNIKASRKRAHRKNVNTWIVCALSVLNIFFSYRKRESSYLKII